MTFKLPSYSFMDHAFYVVAKKSLAIWRSKRFYVFFKNYGIKNWNYFYSHSIFSPLKYKLYHNGKKINIGDTVKFYITKEIGTFKINEDMLEFENIKYKYFGMNSENGNSFNFLSRDILLNETQNDFLNMINDIIIFDGFINFNYDDNFSSL